MPSLKDHYNRLQSVSEIGISVPQLPKHIVKKHIQSIDTTNNFTIHQTEPEPTIQAIPPLITPEPISPTATEELSNRGLSGVFDPKSAAPLSHRLSLTQAFDLFLKRHPNASVRDFLTSKLPEDFPIVETRVIRQRGFLGTSFFPTYILGEESESGVGLKTTWLSSKKKKNNKSSNYPIFLKYSNPPKSSPSQVSRPEIDRGLVGPWAAAASSGAPPLPISRSDSTALSLEEKLGKLRSNFIGSEFVLFSQGANPEKAKLDESIRKELIAVTYQATKNGPREIRAVVPVETPKVPGKVLLEASELDDTVVQMKNKKPRWNEHIQAYVLNFSKRVSKASVKNFQLMTQDEQVQLQFGKVAKDDFNLDFKYPFSPMEAFAVALSAFDMKWCCE